MRIAFHPEAEVPIDLRRQVVAMQDAAWPSERSGDPSPWHDPALEPISMLLLDDEGRVLAALDVLSKDLVHEGAGYRASGLSAVVSDPDRRGEGFGRHLVEAARDHIAASGADLGIFTCDRPLQSFYEAAGWTVLSGTVLVGGTPDDPLPSDRLDKVVLGAFFSEHARATASSFVGARVELYPGTIDRLW